MVNYLYAIADIEKNHEVFAESGEVVASTEVRRMLRADLVSSDLVAAH
jgi:malonyl-CoA decarboxylase